MSTIIQSVFTQRPDIAVPGMLTEGYASDNRYSSRHARGLVLAGYGVFKVPGPQGYQGKSFLEAGGQCFHQPSQDVAADVDAIVTAHATSASALSLSGAALNGVIGAKVMQPGRKVTLVLSSHADFNATNARVKGISAVTAQPLTETLAVPDAGNVTLTTTNYFSSITAIEFDAQGGAGGSFTVGVTALTVAAADFLGIVWRQPFKCAVSSSWLYNLTGLDTSLEGQFLDGEQVSFITKGGLWVVTEEDVNDQDDVYVRIAAGGGGTKLGAFRNDDDSATCVKVPNARFTSSKAAGKAPLFFNLLG